MEAEAKILRCKRHLEQQERPPPDKLHKILDRLEKAEVDIDLLKSTEIGKAVNNLRKDPHVGRRAKELVAKWKGCVNVAVTGDEHSNGVSHNPPPPMPAPPPEPPRPPPPPTDHLDSSLPMDMEISPGDSQEDQDEDDGDVNMDQFISAETMERGEAAIRRERESSRRTEEDEDEVMQPSLDDRLKDVLGASPTRSTEEDNMDGFDVDFAAVFQLANTKKEDRFKLSEGARVDKSSKDKSKPKPPGAADRSKEKEQLLASLNSSIKRYEKRVSESKGASSSSSSSSKTKEELKKRAKEKEKRERERKEKERRKEGKEERERRKERTEGWLKDGIPAVPLPHLDQGDAPKQQQLHNEQKHRHRDVQTQPKTKEGQHHHKAKDGQHHQQHSRSNGAPDVPKPDRPPPESANHSKPDKHNHRREEKEKERPHPHRTTSSDTNLISVTDTNSNDVVKADKHVVKREGENKADKHSKHETDSSKADSSRADKHSKHHHEASAAKSDYKADHTKHADAKQEKRSDSNADHKSEHKTSEHHKKHKQSEPPAVPSKGDNEDSNSNSESSKHKHRKTEDASSSNSKESKSSKKTDNSSAAAASSKPSSTSTSSSKQSSTTTTTTPSSKPAAAPAPAAKGGFSFDDLMNYDDPVKRKKMAKKLQKVEVIGFVEKGEKKLKNEIENGEKQSGEDFSDFPSQSTARASMPARSGAAAETSESFKPPKPVPIPIKIDRDDLDDMLPAIAPEYKPMSKLYNDIEAKSKSGPRAGAEEDADGVFSKKSICAGRMIYAGRKKAGSTKMTSLFDMCMTILGNHIDDLEEVGGIPATLLMPILRKCTDEQLYRLEEYNPHFLEDTPVLWKEHCEKTFRGSKPDEDGMETWRELYDTKFREREEKMKKLAANISMKQRMTTTSMRKTQLAYVDVASAKPPRAARIAQQKYGTGAKSSNSSSKKGASSSSSSSTSGGVDDAAAAAAREENARLRMASMASITADDVDKPVRGLGGRAIQRGGDGGEKRVKIAAPMMAKSMKMMKNRFNSALPFAKR